MDEVCNILHKCRPRCNFGKYKVLHKKLYIPRSFWKEICALYSKHFLKHPLFTTFSLLSIVSDVWYISKKYWLPNKSVKKMFLYKSPYIALLFHSDFYKHLLFIYTSFCRFWSWRGKYWKMLKEKNLKKVDYLQFQKIATVFIFDVELTSLYIF